MTAEEKVKAKWPTAYCNNWLDSHRILHWWICTGVYQDQRSIGPKRLTPDEAWKAAAQMIGPDRGGER